MMQWIRREENRAADQLSHQVRKEYRRRKK
jgi:hypothetical protein